ncbi:MAG TPA: hypothetical protein VN222_15130 [Novosphingobium sp.]|nr:hypothetical protein [Novosphingobium sp.]
MSAGVSPVSPLANWSKAANTQYAATPVSPPVTKASAIGAPVPHAIGEVQDVSPTPPRDPTNPTISLHV